MNSIDRLAKDLYNIMQNKEERGPKPFDPIGEVVKVDETDSDILWVRLPGSEGETPVERTMNANVGDRVRLRFSGGRAWILGNASSPPTDDARANEAHYVAVGASERANQAMDEAEIARLAADSAQADADRAHAAADEADRHAQDATTSASSAYNSANTALSELGIVQDVVGVLELIAEHADYELTSDTEIIAGKWYFIQSGESPSYIYELVETPVAEDLPTYYEIVSIENSVKDYVSSRLTVTGDGLYIQDPTMQSRVLLSPTEGIILTGPNGTQVGKYGETAQIGDPSSFHISLSGTRLGFWKGDESVPTNEIAYISGQKLYITQSVVLQQMDIGTTEVDGGSGQWSWKVHPNANGLNNLNLKWIG